MFLSLSLSGITFMNQVEMNEQIEQIAKRLVGLREALDIGPEEIARVCNLSKEEYLLLESGQVDISVSVLHQIAQAYNIELTTLMFGSEPRMSAYFITRKGKGETVERTKAYKYQSLAMGFSDRIADPFVVTVHPRPAGEPVYLNAHKGQEFNIVIKGRMLIQINGKDLILEEGDSIYFNSALPHGMQALDNKEVQFLAIIL